MVVRILLLLGLLALPTRGWGQAAERIGTVLAVEGVAEVRAAEAREWERLRFRDGIFLNDTVRTAEQSKVKVLLRDDSVMTLAERSEMQFTEFLLTEQQRRSIVNLFVGKVRVLTTRLFGAGSFTEVHTPNAVAGVRGSEGHVQYMAERRQTTTYCPTGDCYMRDPRDPTRELTIPEGHLAQHIGAPGLPPGTREATTTEQQTIIEGTQAAAQDPQETQTTEQQARQQAQEPPGPPRGEAPGVGPTGPSPSAVVTAGPVPTTVVPPSLDARAEAVLAPTLVGPRLGTDNPQSIITPEIAAKTVIQNSLLRLTITIPR
jgi:hypothetical protein